MLFHGQVTCLPAVHPEGRVDCLLAEPRSRFYPSGPVSMIHALVPEDDEQELGLEDIELLGSA